MSAKARAVALLARREHARAELFRKLKDKGHDLDEIESALDRLADVGLQDDARAARNMTRHMATLRGYGPRKIQQNLRQRGLAKPLIDEALAELEFDWRASALRLGHRRAHKTREQIARFLAGRGFSGEIVWDVAREVSDAASRDAPSSHPEEDPSADASASPAWGEE
ncbi:MAG: regulatory protein RecX [Proteobacteria bacterium]|nr:regulatory protein RecX [Pseudomonadota bacterium]MCP4919562.1 regulatory protein RecX [Pseudomonadota bacterium]